MVQLKEFVGGNIVGSGSNYVVVQKGQQTILYRIERLLSPGVEEIYYSIWI